MALIEKKENAETSEKARKISRNKLPSKRSLNLAAVDRKKINWLVALPAVLVILALAAAFSKFAVWDRIVAVDEARAGAETARVQLEAAHARLNDYGDVADEYAHYTYSGMTEEELSRCSRTEIIDLLRRVVIPRATVNTWVVQGNVMTLNVTGSSLQSINMMGAALEKEEMVDFCTVSTAETDGSGLLSGGDAEAGGVLANLIVYLADVTTEEGGSGT